MSDLISRSALIEELKNIEVTIDYEALKKLVNVAKDEDVLETIIKYVMWQSSEISMQHIETQPTVEEREVVHGEWEYHWFDSICSVCGYINKADGVTRIRNDHNFCPNCGADMRGKKNESNL